MARMYFHAYHSFLTAISPLGDAECGRLFRALLEYSSTGKAPELRGNERFVFPMLAETIRRDAAAYEEKCAKLRSNGSKAKAAGCKRKKANDGFCVQEEEKEEDEEED